ncbi:MAG TPA: rhomboid family intramembrane serine protease [Ktedonobacterales bacterium]|nr:rhomboid family intramembrane serine protease [Ktedonobacterales bacterium]
MEQATDARALVTRADALLLDGEVREAAAVYAEAVQADPALAAGHLGLAEANLALGAYAIVHVAVQHVLELAPESADAALAAAINLVLERRWDEALAQLDRVAELDPGRAYAHALRGYCLRRMGRSYDAQQAEGKARRLSSGKDFAPLFPQPALMAPLPVAPHRMPAGSEPGTVPNGDPPRPRSWEGASALRRAQVRARFATRNVPVVTFGLIIINLIVYLFTALSVGGNFYSPGDVIQPSTPFTPGAIGLYYYGGQFAPVMLHDPLQWYRVFTAMFLHASIPHIGLNMLSLYFVGVVVEQLFGHWRFTAVYLVSGILAGVAQFLGPQGGISVGASGAIFGIFGAFGAFIFLRRNLLGRAANAVIGQWLFFLVINLVYSFVNPDIALYDHLGGLVSGIVLGALLLPGALGSRGLR